MKYGFTLLHGWCVATLLAVCASAHVSTAATFSTFYVRSGGDDGADGHTPATAFATVRQAALQMQNPGDLVIVGPGTFVEGNIEPARSGITGHPVTFMADASGLSTGDAPGAVTIAPPMDQTTGFILLGMHDVTIDGFTIVGTVDAGIQIRAADVASGGAASADVTVRNTVVTNSLKRGIDITAAGTVVVENNVAQNNGSAGISIIGAPGSGVTVSVAGNRLENNGDDNQVAGGISVFGAVAGSIADNSVTGSQGDGITVRMSSALSVLRNDIMNSGGNGIGIGVSQEPAGADFVLNANQISGSVAAGISVFATGSVQATANLVTHSGSTGLSIQGGALSIPATVSNNTLGTSGAHGLFLAAVQAGAVQNNIIFSNGDTGITVRGADNTRLINNLVYANVTDGVALGTANMSASDAQVINNTVYSNGGWGLRIGDDLVASPNASVLDNIFALNRGGGVTAAHTSTCGYVSGFNINMDGYGPDTPKNPYDSSARPYFGNPAGADAILGGDGFADDDFSLQQVRGGQNWNSPGVDAGFAAVTDVGLTGSTASNGQPDVGQLDIGFHYGASADQQITLPVPYMPIFVRAHGDDGNDGLDPHRALASIQEGAHKGQAGATVVVGPGRYEEGNIHPIPNGGPTTFFADTTGMATGDVPGVVLVDASGQPTGFLLSGACAPVVDGFYVTGSTTDAGIQVRAGGDGSRVRNNVVFSNQSSGIEVIQADTVEIRNNLVYANGTGGIRVTQSNGSSVVNNTIYGNAVDALLVGGTADSEASPGTSVLRNIVAGNGGGIKTLPNSFAGYVTAFNIVPDGFQGNTPRGDADFIADPLLVNPAGLDGTLGGTHFLDDDFHLMQGGAQASPAVDVDFSDMGTLADGSTRSDGLPDLGPLDAGYHYPFFPRTPVPKAPGTVVFVRAQGRDANAGTSPQTALASIKKALAVIEGDGVIVVGPGTYRERNLRIGGAKRDALAVVLGDAAGVLSSDAPGEVVIDAAGGAAPLVFGPALIDGIMLTGAGGTGIRVLGGASDVTLRNAKICGNAGGGLLSSGNGVSVVNNLVCNNGRLAINVRLSRVQRVTQVLSNTVAGNLGQGVLLHEMGATASHILLYNNIVSGNGSTGITVRARRGASAVSGHNLNTDGYGHATAHGAGDLTVAPGFMIGAAQPGLGCASADEYRVTPGSPIIDAGAASAIEIGTGGRSVTAAGTPDTGPADLGFHYPATP